MTNSTEDTKAEEAPVEGSRSSCLDGTSQGSYPSTPDSSRTKSDSRGSSVVRTQTLNDTPDIQIISNKDISLDVNSVDSSSISTTAQDSILPESNTEGLNNKSSLPDTADSSSLNTDSTKPNGTKIEITSPEKESEQSTNTKKDVWDDSKRINNFRPANIDVEEEEKPNRIFQHPPEEYLPMLPDDKEDHELQEWDSDVLPTPPDGGWGWMVVFGSFMIHVFADGFTYTLGIFYVHLLNYYGVSKAAAAWIVSILTGVTLGSGPLSGALVNKFGCRAVVIMGTLLASLMIGISVLATNIETLYVTIGLGAGLGFGLIYLPAIVCVTAYFERRRSFATGIAVCGSGLGTFIFSPLVEYLIEEFNWKGAFIVISGLMLNCIFFGALFRPLEKPKVRRVAPKSSVPYSTQCSVDSAPSIKRENSIPVPYIQVASKGNIKPNNHVEISTNDDIRKNLSEANLHPVRVTRRSRLISASEAPMDLNRINSHGSLNPVLALRGGEESLRKTASQHLFEKAPSQVALGKHHDENDSTISLSNTRNSSFRSRRASALHMNSTKTTEKEDNVFGSIRRYIRSSMVAFHSFMDLDLLADPIFQLFSLSNFFTSIGFFAPYIFIVDRALDIKIPQESTATLISIIGFSNTISRVLLGYISDMACINRLYLYNMALTICGIATCMSIWLPTFWGQALYAAIFGCTSGAYVGLTSVVLVDLLGMERLTNAFGLLLLFQGIASIVGPPICGSLYSMAQNYDYTFLLAGGMIAISGVMLFSVPFVQRYIDRKNKRKQLANHA